MLQQDTALMPQFTRSDARVSELLDRMHEIADLSALGALAEWDQNTEMPEGAGEVRGDQMATLQGVLHERWRSHQLRCKRLALLAALLPHRLTPSGEETQITQVVTNGGVS